MWFLGGRRQWVAVSERRGVLQRPGESPGVRGLSELFMGMRGGERREEGKVF